MTQLSTCWISWLPTIAIPGAIFFLSWTITKMRPITKATIITALMTETMTVTVNSESEEYVCEDGDAIVELLLSMEGRR